jgi:hypothetical protein
MFRGKLLTAVVVSFAIAGVGRGDSVQLTNGDLLNGEVISLDARELKLKSEIHGQMTIARAKVAAVAFGEKNLLMELAEAARAAAKQPANDRAGTKSDRVGGGWVQSGSGKAGAPGTGRPGGLGARDPLSGARSTQDVLNELERQGVTGLDLEQFKSAFPVLKDPEARKYFDEKAGGLLRGDISVQDIRKDAIKARDELKKATKGLGPEVDQALGGYLNILENFIRETDPGSEDAAKPLEKKATPSGKR